MSLPKSTNTDRILKAISNPEFVQDSNKVIKMISSVPEMVDSRTIEVKPLIPPMVKLLANHNATIKQLSCEFLVRASENYPEIGLLAGNVLAQDIVDPNPKIRALAIAAICSLNSDEIAEISVDSVVSGLRDSNPTVRKSAVTGTGKLFLHHPEIVQNSDLIDRLYSTVRDPDPTVMTFALQTLNVILKAEGGIVINKAMALYLLKRLPKLQEMEFCFVVDYLEQFYRCEEEDSEVKLTIMNGLDPFLDSQSGPIVLSSAKLFYKCIWSTSMDSEVTRHFVQRLKINRFLHNKFNQDFQCDLLEFLTGIENINEYLGDLYKEVRIKGKDSHKLTRAKIKFLGKIATSKNANEIKIYLLDKLKAIHPEVRNEAINVLCDISLQNDDDADFLKSLSELLETDFEGYSLIFLSQIRKISRIAASSELFSKLLRLSVIDGIELSKSDLSNILWILTNHARVVKESPYVLEAVIQNFERRLVEERLLHELLFCGVQVFINYPPQTQFALGQIFRLCLDEEESEPDLKKKVSFYSKVLQKGNLIQAVRV